jgi:hypothetical protein
MQYLVFDNTEVCMQYLEFGNTEVYYFVFGNTVGQDSKGLLDYTMRRMDCLHPQVD